MKHLKFIILYGILLLFIASAMTSCSDDEPEWTNLPEESIRIYPVTSVLVESQTIEGDFKSEFIKLGHGAHYVINSVDDIPDLLFFSQEMAYFKSLDIDFTKNTLLLVFNRSWYELANTTLWYRYSNVEQKYVLNFNLDGYASQELPNEGAYLCMGAMIVPKVHDDEVNFIITTSLTNS